MEVDVFVQPTRADFKYEQKILVLENILKTLRESNSVFKCSFEIVASPTRIWNSQTY